MVVVLKIMLVVLGDISVDGDDRESRAGTVIIMVIMVWCKYSYDLYPDNSILRL